MSAPASLRTSASAARGSKPSGAHGWRVTGVFSSGVDHLASEGVALSLGVLGPGAAAGGNISVESVPAVVAAAGKSEFKTVGSVDGMTDGEK